MGIYCSAGSACNNGDQTPSHVLTAIGLTKDEAWSSLRFTISEDTTIEDVDYAVEIIKTVAELLR
jgi:cysteine desulfurase